MISTDSDGESDPIGSDPDLFSALVEARELGFLGPSPIEDQVRHSLLFVGVAHTAPVMAVDLGSGGGLPGLVLARAWLSSSWVLLDGNKRRTEFLASTVLALGMGERVSVRCERAEESGRVASLRGAADLVTARSFGPPAVVAECSAPLLAVGGLLIVSEPPGGNPDRWPAASLLQLGLVPDGVLTSPAAFQRLRLLAACPDRYPRRVGIPSKRPLF